RSGRGSVHEGGRPAERPHGAMSIASPSPLTPAKHLVQQRPRQSKVEPFGWGRKLQCHSVFPQTDQPGLTQLAHGEAGQYSGFAGLRQDNDFNPIAAPVRCSTGSDFLRAGQRNY
ncbi:MAG: hypothetical protein J7457_08610, partial [Roseiflexus sp.]|nr:hypothetical protein [Roseiflexus sp.]